MGDTFLKLKLKDQERSMQLLTADAELSQLRHLKVSLQELAMYGCPCMLYGQQVS